MDVLKEFVIIMARGELRELIQCFSRCTSMLSGPGAELDLRFFIFCLIIDGVKLMLLRKFSQLGVESTAVSGSFGSGMKDLQKLSANNSATSRLLLHRVPLGCWIRGTLTFEHRAFRTYWWNFFWLLLKITDCSYAFLAFCNLIDSSFEKSL